MQFNEIIKKILVRTCIYFTATTFFMLIVYGIMVGLKDGLSPLSLILILPFSLCFAIGNVLLRYSKLQKPLAVVLHYILSVGGAYMCLYLPTRDPNSTPSNAFVFFIALTLIYVIIMGAIGLYKGRAKRLQRDSKEYKSLYNNNKNSKK